MNYWINLRKCFLNQKVSKDYSEFYNLLRTLVEQEKVLCPINYSVIVELLKQDNFESRINTAKVIDIFSNSVCLIFELEREGLELQYYVRQKLLSENYLTPINEYVWLKIPYAMGLGIPYNDQVDAATQNEVQIKFFTYSWTVKLEELMEKYSRNDAIPFLDYTTTTDKLNEGKFNHQDEVKSITQLFKDELKGGLDFYLNTFERFFIWLYKVSPKTLESLKVNFNINNPVQLRNKIEKDIVDNDIDKYLPNIFINACIHTLMRWDRSRKFKPNDIYDFQHARAALPYYNYFFTEAPLKHIVYSKPYELANKYNCVVENNIKEVNQLLLKIAS